MRLQSLMPNLHPPKKRISIFLNSSNHCSQYISENDSMNLNLLHEKNNFHKRFVSKFVNKIKTEDTDYDKYIDYGMINKSNDFYKDNNNLVESNSFNDCNRIGFLWNNFRHESTVANCNDSSQYNNSSSFSKSQLLNCTGRNCNHPRSFKTIIEKNHHRSFRVKPQKKNSKLNHVNINLKLNYKFSNHAKSIFIGNSKEIRNASINVTQNKLVLPKAKIPSLLKNDLVNAVKPKNFKIWIKGNSYSKNAIKNYVQMKRYNSNKNS